MSVDDLVARLLRALGDLGERGATMAFVISDNGMFWGEHGLVGKRQPYRESVRVPFLMRWPGHVQPGSHAARLVANLDIAPTALQAAGIDPAGLQPEIDGRSLLGGDRRDHLLLEYYLDPGKSADIPSWAAIWRPDVEYVEYDETGAAAPSFREYYDLQADPWQLRNLLGDGRPGNDPPTAALQAQLLADRACQGTSGPTACP